MKLAIDSLNLSYKNRRVSSGWSFTATPGVTGVLGINGAGKSTLFDAICGIKKPDTGSIHLDGTPITPGAIDSQRVAYMTQDMTFPGFITLKQAVCYAQWIRGYPWRQATAHATTALDAVGLADRANRRVNTLSGGMTRRLALAATIAGNPDLVLLDEPSTGLDPQQRHTMVELIRTITGTVLLSSHVLEDVLTLADTIVLLHNTTIAFHGTVTDFLSHAPDPQSRDAMWAAFTTLTTQTPTS